MLRHLRDLLNGSGDFGRNLGELLLGELHTRCFEVKVAHPVDRDEMDVVVRHIDADDRHADTLAGQHLLHGLGHLLRENQGIMVLNCIVYYLGINNLANFKTNVFVPTVSKCTTARASGPVSS